MERLFLKKFQNDQNLKISVHAKYFLYFMRAFLNFESDSKILRSKRCRFGVSRFGLAGFKRKFRKTENWTARVFTVGVKWKSIFAFYALKPICIRANSALKMHRNKLFYNNKMPHFLTLWFNLCALFLKVSFFFSGSWGGFFQNPRGWKFPE